jgi:hypothetical protein
VNPCPQVRAHPGYRQPGTNVHAVIGGYPQAWVEIARKTEKGKPANVHAVISELAAGLRARGFGYPRTLPKGKRALRITRPRASQQEIRI